MKPSIYNYDDFRLFLSAWFAWRNSERKYSLRAFARDAGFSSPNILQSVIAGKKKLGRVGTTRFATGLGLTEDESKYFENLVHLNQSATDDERLRYYNRLVAHPKRKALSPLEAPRLMFFREWLAPVIYEMMDFPDFRPSAEWIAKQFTTPPRIAEIRKAMADLVTARLVAVDKEGLWHKTELAVSSGDNVKDIHLFAYHETALEKTADALLNVPMQERSFNVITNSIPKAAFERLRNKFESFEQEILSIIDSTPGPRDEVVQIGWYVFPTVRRTKRSSDT